MAAIPAFLAYLELERDADERSVRRAYARRLKQIDADQNPHEFQALREAYEAALRWVQAQNEKASQLSVASPGNEYGTVEEIAPAPPSPSVQHVRDQSESIDSQPLGPSEIVVVPPGSASSEDDQPGAVADEVFQEFIAKLGPHYQDLEQVKRDLECSLGDARLINLEARAFFEWCLVCWLASGWRPGNEALIGIATARFNWDKDRQQLYRFGRPGEILDYAIHELTVFKQQNATQRNHQLEAIRKLRSNARPKPGELIRYLPVVEQLAVGFPMLLPLITNADNVQRWREWDRAIPGWRRWIAYRRAQPVGNSQQAKGGHHRWYIGFVIVLLIRGLSGLGNSTPAEPSPNYRPSSSLESSLAQQHASTLAPNIASQNSIAALQSAWAQQIRAKIRSHVAIPKGTPLDARVEFAVVQRPNGEVIEVAVKQSSGFQEYDLAMQRAIYKASPLPKAPNSQVFARDLVLKFTPNEDLRR